MPTKPPDWITPGAQVVIGGWPVLSGSYDIATVERLTATQVVISEGRVRFRIKDLLEVGGERKLFDPTDPTVRRAMAGQREIEAMDRAWFAVQQYPRRIRLTASEDAEARAHLRAELAAVIDAMDTVDGLQERED